MLIVDPKLLRLSASSCIALVLCCYLVQGVAAATTSRRPRVDQGANCTNSMPTIDRCASQATYSYTTASNSYPKNGRELKASCERIAEGVKCLKSSTKCLNAVARRSLSAYTTARSRHSKKLCSNLEDSKSIDFWKSAECIGTPSRKSMMIDDEKELIKTLQFLADNTTMKFDDRFNRACCAASKYKIKALNSIEPECSKYKSTVEDMINSMVGELLETACPEEGKLNEICSKIQKVVLPKEWKASSLTGAALQLIVSLSEEKPEN